MVIDLSCLRMHTEDLKLFFKKGDIEGFEILVTRPYFKHRQGVTFETGGFIGFAGWVSSINSKPFLNAFEKWLDYLKKEKEL